MYSSEHYLSKIERNVNVLDKAPEEVRQQCLSHIKWAKELAKRLDNLDYHERDVAIKNIIETMDNDYEIMGFGLEEKGRSR